KVSAYEIDMNRYRLTHDELIAQYRRDGVNPQKIVSSHERHKQSIKELKKFFGERQFVPRDSLTRNIAAESDLVIALGGDDHFQYVSHFVDDTPIMGVNSDPLSSEGMLNYFTAANFGRIARRLAQDDFKVEHWMRLEARLNGAKLPLATAHYFLGESDREDISHYILEYRGKSEEQKSSGILVVTGAGSTGWYNSAYSYLHADGNKFPKTRKRAAFFVTEIHRGSLTGHSMLEGVLEEGEEIVVYSLNKHAGRFSVDSCDRYDFGRGAKAVIRISDKPLKVVARLE
ncbi:MAG: NAD(+)/NADH kinase, partial [Thaumarchaeota archaeon]|nr:NAD(+)/NADH kinase [Nitrososphaerota archaeon]